jgi:hypothetical protein
VLVVAVLVLFVVLARLVGVQEGPDDRPDAA